MSEFISPVILDRIPSYIQEQYPVYVQFLTDYIGFLERDQGFLQILNDWRYNMEPSNNVDPYIDQMLADLGMALQRSITVPKSTLLYFLRDLFLSKGSAQSFQLLFGILFGAPAIIDYPRDSLMYLSNASYGETDYIYTTTNVWYGTQEYQFIMENIAQYGGTVKGSNSGVTAAVQSIEAIGYNGGFYLQIQILKPLAEFLPNDLITITVSTTSINEPILSIANVSILTPGAGYVPPDKVVVHGALIAGRLVVDHTLGGGITGLVIDTPGCGYTVGANITANTGTYGDGFSAYVSSVNGTGGITGVQIDTEGYNYNTLPSLRVNQTTSGTCLASISPLSTTIGQIAKIRTVIPYLFQGSAASLTVTTQSLNGSGATFAITASTRFTTMGWVDQKGFLGYNTTTLDSYKYQSYSYRITSGIDPSQYQDLVTSLLHPAGFVKTFCVSIQNAPVSVFATPGFDVTIPYVIQEYGTTVLYTLSDFSILNQAAGNYLMATLDNVGTLAAFITSGGDELIWH